MQLVLFKESLYFPGVHSRHGGSSQPAGHAVWPLLLSHTGVTAAVSLHPDGQVAPSCGSVSASRSQTGVVAGVKIHPSVQSSVTGSSSQIGCIVVVLVKKMQLPVLF
jgi:hypothetical protein